jgi:hypothetical protein
VVIALKPIDLPSSVDLTIIKLDLTFAPSYKPSDPIRQNGKRIPHHFRCIPRLLFIFFAIILITIITNSSDEYRNKIKCCTNIFLSYCSILHTVRTSVNNVFRTLLYLIISYFR